MELVQNKMSKETHKLHANESNGKYPLKTRFLFELSEKKII
jgi:hypothetical protein